MIQIRPESRVKVQPKSLSTILITFRRSSKKRYRLPLKAPLAYLNSLSLSRTHSQSLRRQNIYHQERMELIAKRTARWTKTRKKTLLPRKSRRRILTCQLSRRPLPQTLQKCKSLQLHQRMQLSQAMCPLDWSHPTMASPWTRQDWNSIIQPRQRAVPVTTLETQSSQIKAGKHMIQKLIKSRPHLRPIAKTHQRSQQMKRRQQQLPRKVPANREPPWIDWLRTNSFLRSRIHLHHRLKWL